MTNDQTSAAPPIGGGAADVIGMHEAMDACRRARRLAWWQVAVELGHNTRQIQGMRQGVASAPLIEHATAWLLGRHTAPPRRP